MYNLDQLLYYNQVQKEKFYGAELVFNVRDDLTSNVMHCVNRN